MSGSPRDDELLFVDEDEGAVVSAAPVGECWRVLVVDDDPDVHTTTAFALRGTRILHRPLQFLHAKSAEEACVLLKRETDIAVILLDVVMEREDSGLQLVRTIREELGLSESRIILRTGQPGYAPEIEAIRDYDINDYKTKAELTRNKLYTTLTAAIRSYDQVRRLDFSRRGLDRVSAATQELLAITDLSGFATGILGQLGSILGEVPSGIVCLVREGGSGAVTVAAAGRLLGTHGLTLDQLRDAGVQQALRECLQSGQPIYHDHFLTFLLPSRQGRGLLVFSDLSRPVDEDARRLLQLFCNSVSIGLDNTLLFSQLHNYAFFDSLSQLPNRRSLIQRIDECLSRGGRSTHTLALIDIDQFAEINDALGHYFGDLLLQGVALRLRDALGVACHLARITGDTFGMLGPTEALQPGALLALFKSPFVIDDQELQVSVTIGIASLSDTEGDGSEALKDANIALRRAKMGHRGDASTFTREMAVDIRERVKLLQALRHAMERQRLFLVFQPQFDFSSGRVCGVEALLRWRGEDGKLIPPDRFIPIAERSGMIVTIGQWVTRMACFRQADLARNGYPDIRVAINLSVIQLRHPQYLDSLRAALADSGAQPGMIELEITESVAMEEADFIGSTLDAIRAVGVKVAIDDFGTGFSSLAYLQRLRADRLKIDRAFVTDIVGDERARRIPELVIQLGHKLDLIVVAEGVENAEQAELLRHMGCDEAQGYHFARPMEPEQLMSWLAARRDSGAGA